MSSVEEINFLGQSEIPFLFVIDFEGKNLNVIRLEEAEKNGFLFDIQGITNYDYTESGKIKNNFFWKKTPQPFEAYQKSFDIVQEGLHRGDSFLCNLTCSTPLETDLSLEQIFSASKAKYKLFFKENFVCFSPEIFIKIDEQGIISSHPMKGTIDASIPDAKQLIMNDLKEKAEHNTIVDLIRNDLSKVAKKVRVTKFRYVDLLQTNDKNLYQVSSEIQGDLPENWKNNIGSILTTLLPAGSISGAPKKSTLELIKKAETFERNYYTGIFGIFDGKTLNSGVMIRFIEQKNGQFFFKSGGGITVFSDLNAEYQEFINKIYVPIS
jgi:para-aminobenzoate synthetase component I